MQTPQDKAVTEQVLFSFMLHSKCQKVVTWNILLFKKNAKTRKTCLSEFEKTSPTFIFVSQSIPWLSFKLAPFYI